MSSSKPELPPGPVRNARASRLSAQEVELLASVAKQRDSAPHGQKNQAVALAAELLGCDTKTVYAKLKMAGYDAPRKPRDRASRKSVLSDDQLNLLSDTLRGSVNGKGQRMPVRTAIDIVAASERKRGHAFPNVSATTVNRQLRERYLHPEQLLAPSAHLELTSLYPNHTHQVDSTTGAYYYLPNNRLRWMDETEFNKNKVANIVKASTDLLTRYSLADHTTHMFKVRYFLGGESTENLLSFLVWAFWKQDSSPMWGVPSILMADQGSANKSKLMRKFCERLDIQLELHMPGNARATGSVEKSHDLARMHLETRYHFQDPREVTLEKLNSDAESWAADYCSTRVHRRHGRTRSAAWMEINRYPGALRTPASLEALKSCAVSEPETPRVGNDGKLRRGGHVYCVDVVPGVLAGQRITVQTNVFRAPAIDVLHACPMTGEKTWHAVDPEVRTEWGFSGEHVIGQPHRGRADDILDTNRKMAKRRLYDVGDGLPTLAEAEKARKQHRQALATTIDHMADVRASKVPTYMPRRTVPISLEAAAFVPAALNVVQACKRLKDALGADYSPEVYAWVSAKFPQGVPEDQVAAIASQFAPTSPSLASGTIGLKAVGGE